MKRTRKISANNFFLKCVRMHARTFNLAECRVQIIYSCNLNSSNLFAVYLFIIFRIEIADSVMMAESEGLSHEYMNL